MSSLMLQNNNMWLAVELEPLHFNYLNVVTRETIYTRKQAQLAFKCENKTFTLLDGQFLQGARP